MGTRSTSDLILVLGGTGKTGKRVARRLEARGVPVRIGSRSVEPPFDWNDADTWEPALRGARSAYIAYAADLAAPGADDTIGAFAEQAVACGVRRLVLLSGRGEEGARRCEETVQQSGAEWTVLRSSWFSQNFSESFLCEGISRGELALPCENVAEPFVDADDIADVAVEALTEDGHAGKAYELTGPRLLTFEEAVGEIARASGRRMRFVRVSEEAFASMLAEEGVPAHVVQLLVHLFVTVLDGRNAWLADGVQQALGCRPRDFAYYARQAAACGAWGNLRPRSNDSVEFRSY